MICFLVPSEGFLYITTVLNANFVFGKSDENVVPARHVPWLSWSLDVEIMVLHAENYAGGIRVWPKHQKTQNNPTFFRAKSPIATAFKVKPDMIMDWNFELKNGLGKRTSQSHETQIAISHGAVARLLLGSLCNAWSCMNWKSSLTTKTVHPSNKIIKIKHKEEHNRTKSHINLALAKRWQISSLDSWHHDISLSWVTPQEGELHPLHHPETIPRQKKTL